MTITFFVFNGIVVIYRIMFNPSCLKAGLHAPVTSSFEQLGDTLSMVRIRIDVFYKCDVVNSREFDH